MNRTTELNRLGQRVLVIFGARVGMGGRYTPPERWPFRMSLSVSMGKLLG